jgi:hypothetical protein
MQQVTDWLAKLGLGQYAQRFAENNISFSILPDLTDQHLKEIGVSLGHRLRLLRAIAELTRGEKEVSKPAVASRETCRAFGGVSVRISGVWQDFQASSSMQEWQRKAI